jgi:RHS repeat-associated protein
MAYNQGNEVGHVIYDAFGQIVENTIPLTLTGRLFTGQTFDASTGLYYYNARYYDPQVGQFTQPDSIVADPLNPAAWNRFSYVHNAPTNYIDPSGHCPLCFVAIGASLAAMGGAIHYTATHPGASFDRGEYLSTVWRWTKWGGVGGAAFAVIGPNVGLFALEESAMAGVTASQLLNAGFTTGAASVIVTGLAQGGYKELTQVEDAFLSGFYSAYTLSLATNAIAAFFNLPPTAIVRRALISGVVGATYGGMRGDTTFSEIATNFAASFIYGITSPSISVTSNKLGYIVMGTTPRTPGLYPPVLFARDYLAQGMGYSISSLSMAAIKPSMLKFYWQKASEGWQWFITH